MLVAIVVDTHHQSAAEAHEGNGRLECAAVGPEVHDADLGLGGAVRCLDKRFKVNALLQKVKVALGLRNGVEVFVGGGKLNSLPREGVKGLEQEAFALMRKAFDVVTIEPIVEEDGFGN